MWKKLSALICLLSFACSGCQDSGVSPGIAPFPSTNAIDSGTNEPLLEKTAPVDPADNKVKPAADEDISINIRQRLIKNGVTTNVENIKIVTQNGAVVLRGIVKSAEEKQRIQEVAEAVAGTPNVENWIEVE